MLVIVAVFGALVLVWTAMRGRQRLRELAIRERIALIERGLVPAPEADPERFERMVGLGRSENPQAQRYQSAGIMFMGFGAGLICLISFAAGVPAIGFGVGGALVLLGLAMYGNGSLIASNTPPDRSPARPSLARTPPEPPSNVAP